MTDAPEAPVTTPHYEACQKKARDRDRLAGEALVTNKTALFDALSAFHVAIVTVRFDGCGDSGQIEEIEAEADGSEIALPEIAIEIARPLYDGSGTGRLNLPLREAIEQLAYDFLEETHAGWENSDGACGEFTFDVAKRSITLAYNEPYTDTEYSEHSW